MTKSKCKAIMTFGDDFGDNSCTFRCELEDGHDGSHRESGSMYNEFPYTVAWTEDMRTKCEVCAARMEEQDEHMCEVCYKTICPTCATVKNGDRYAARCEQHKSTKIEEGLFVCLKGCWRGPFEEAAQHPVADGDRGLFCPQCGAGATPDEADK